MLAGGMILRLVYGILRGFDCTGDLQLYCANKKIQFTRFHCNIFPKKRMSPDA